MLRAGAAALDITPPLGTPLVGYFHERRAATVHDPLHVRAFVLEREGEAIAVAVLDVIGVRRAFLDRVKARVAEAVGLAPERVLLCCTHTHTGPATGEDSYTDWLIERVADAVALAFRRLEPARAGWGRATEERPVFNRRYRMKDGSVQTNPGVGNPEVVAPVGPVDPEVGVLALVRPEGGTIGLLANYTLHYVGVPDDAHAISADYFGVFAELIQRLRGERFVAALANGAAGDINNIDVLGGTRARNDRYHHVERVAARVAAAALWAWNEIDLGDDLPLGAAMREVALERRAPPTDAEREQARAIEARLAAGGPVTMGERVFARRILRAPATREAPGESVTRTWVQALRVGDLALVGVPGELLVEPGLEIKRRSPIPQTLVIELANDSVGYLPHARAYDEGAYEPEASPFLPGCAEQIVETAIELLASLR